MKIVGQIASLASLLAVAAVVLARRSSAADGQSERGLSRRDEAQAAVVDRPGNVHVPSNYRAAYEFLGTWAMAANKRRWIERASHCLCEPQRDRCVSHEQGTHAVQYVVDITAWAPDPADERIAPLDTSVRRIRYDGTKTIAHTSER